MSENCPKCGKEKIAVCPICGKPVDVYSRPCGYLRPTSCWNDGKQEEFHDRVNYTFWGKQPIDEQDKNTE